MIVELDIVDSGEMALHFVHDLISRSVPYIEILIGTACGNHGAILAETEFKQRLLIVLRMALEYFDAATLSRDEGSHIPTPDGLVHGVGNQIRVVVREGQAGHGVGVSQQHVLDLPLQNVVLLYLVVDAREKDSVVDHSATRQRVGLDRLVLRNGLSLADIPENERAVVTDAADGVVKQTDRVDLLRVLFELLDSFLDLHVEQGHRLVRTAAHQSMLVGRIHVQLQYRLFVALHAAEVHLVHVRVVDVPEQDLFVSSATCQDSAAFIEFQAEHLSTVSQ